MKILYTVGITLIFSTISALVTAHFVSSSWESRWHKSDLIGFGMRASEDLILATKIRGGQADTLVKDLEREAQIRFLLQYRYRQHGDKDNRWAYEYSLQMINAYSHRYHLSLAAPFTGIKPPEKPYTDQLFSEIVNRPSETDWPSWFDDINTTIPYGSAKR